MINESTLTPDEVEFLRLCREHDLTYSYSDDYRYYEAGERQYRRIRKFAERLDNHRVAEIWNAVADEKLQPRLCKDFYWFSA